MENTPLIAENDEDGSEKDKTKKKSKLRLVNVEKPADEERPAKREKAETPASADKPDKEPELVESAAEAPAAETVSEAEAPSDGSLSQAEVAHVAQTVAEAKVQELPADPEAAEDMAVEIFWREVAEHGDPEAAEHAAAAPLGVNPEELSEFSDEEEPMPEAEEAEEAVEEAPQAVEDHRELIIDHSEAILEDEGEATPPTPPGGGGTSGRPPHGPPPPFGPGGLAAPGGPGGLNPNFIPPTPTPAAPERHVPEYHEANPAAMALFGGIIGYLIGRRRGRIKTEKRLLPVQKKLEKQVNDLQWELQKKELRIRRVATEKVRQNRPAVIEALSAKTTIERSAVSQKAPETPLAESVVIEERRRAPEAHQLHGAPAAREHIGQVIVAEAIPAAKRAEKLEPKIAKPEKQAAELPTGKHIETLSRADLLSISEKIIVDGSSLRQIYETHLIGERGLRRLVGEHLRGGDLKRALRQEVIEREIDFERDPAMRDIKASGAVDDPGGKAKLNELIEKASSSVSGSKEAAFFRARASYEATQQLQQQKHRRMMDVSLIGIILILVALVALLIIRHG